MEDATENLDIKGPSPALDPERFSPPIRNRVKLYVAGAPITRATSAGDSAMIKSTPMLHKQHGKE